MGAIGAVVDINEALVMLFIFGARRLCSMVGVSVQHRGLDWISRERERAHYWRRVYRENIHGTTSS